MTPTRYLGDEEIENLINIVRRHCKIGKVVRTPQGSSFDRGYIPPMKQVGEAPPLLPFVHSISAAFVQPQLGYPIRSCSGPCE
jgi:hypothetical protein